MTETQRSHPAVPLRTWLSLVFLMAALESALCGWLLLRIPGDAENAIFAGLSLPRLVLGVVFAAGLVGSLAAGLRLLMSGSFAAALLGIIRRQHRWLSILLAIGAAVLWAAVFLPVYRAGNFAAYFERLKPLFLWGVLLAVQALFFMISMRIDEQGGLQIHKDDRQLLTLSGMIFAGFCTLLGFIALTRWGISPPVEFWEKTGVPLLAGQVFIAWMLGLVLLIPGSKTRPARRIPIDLVLFMLIWAISAVLWVQEPMQFNHFNPGPFPPNNQYYPNSDAETYDFAAQKALIGTDPGYVDKPFYSTMLLGFHMLAGQDINRVIDLQTALLAVFPAVIYLLGTRLQNRAGGLVAALLANFKVLNAIRAQALIWKTSTPKLMMSEFTNAVLLALLILFVWKWFSQKKQFPISALAAGGVLGLAVLTRHNNWLFLPLVLALILLGLWKTKKTLLIHAALFITMFFATIGPWMGYSQQHYGEALPFMNALTGSVLKNRINPLIDQATPTPQPETFLPSGAGLKTAASSSNSAYGQFIQPVDLESGGSDQPVILHPVVDAITRHFFHNLVSTALTLPVTPIMDDIETTIRSSEVAHIWQLVWNGQLSPHQLLLLLFNLLLVAIGLAQSWQRWKLAGLMPLILQIGYLLATAAATTSGGRYIVPADWVILVYYALGIVQVLTFLTTNIWKLSPPATLAAPAHPPQKTWHLGGTAALFLLLGLLPAISMSAFTPAYPVYSQAEIIEHVLQPAPGVDQKALSPLIAAVEQKQLQVIHGKLLYPKYLDFRDDRSYELNITDGQKGIPSLVFNVLGMRKEFRKGQLVMENAPPEMINGSDAVVFACPNQQIAYALVLLDERHEQQLFIHPDWPQVNCPE